LDPEEMMILHRFLRGRYPQDQDGLRTGVENLDGVCGKEEHEDQTKVLMVCHLFAESQRAGKREKAATGITAAIRKHFALAMEDTVWMNFEAIGVG
jgi:hypothetical protein